MMLVAEGLHQKIHKSYIYISIAFSLIVELINMRLRRNREPVDLNNESLEKRHCVRKKEWLYL